MHEKTAIITSDKKNRIVMHENPNPFRLSYAGI